MPRDESSVPLPSYQFLFPSFLYGSLAENECVAIAPSCLPQISTQLYLNTLDLLSRVYRSEIPARPDLSSPLDTFAV